MTDLTTIPQLARQLNRPATSINRVARRLGLARVGRDYLLTRGQVRQIMKALGKVRVRGQRTTHRAAAGSSPRIASERTDPPGVSDFRSSESVVFTSAALDLMTCLQDGCDDLVAQMAEDFARKRYASSGKTADFIEVEAQDVRAAGTELLRLTNS